MPELPEVEVVKRSLKQAIFGLTIKNIEIRNKFLRYNIDEKSLNKMAKSKILSVNRRAKYIIVNLDNAYSILIHLGMTGKIIIISNNIKRNSSFYYDIKDNKPNHDHLVLNFNKNIKLVYNDVRKFGFIKLSKTRNLKSNSHLKKLGPEPLSKLFNFKYFKDKIKKRKTKLKDILMNQEFVAGLGNIYTNEAIFLSKISPKKRLNKLSDNKIKLLIFNIKKVLIKAIKEGGSSIKDFNNIKGKRGNFQQFFNVYGRKNQKCSNKGCVGIIKKIVISNRSTFYCSVCQKY